MAVGVLRDGRMPFSPSGGLCDGRPCDGANLAACAQSRCFGKPDRVRRRPFSLAYATLLDARKRPWADSAESVFLLPSQDLPPMSASLPLSVPEGSQGGLPIHRVLSRQRRPRCPRVALRGTREAGEPFSRGRPPVAGRSVDRRAQRRNHRHPLQRPHRRLSRHRSGNARDDSTAAPSQGSVDRPSRSSSD